MISAIGEEQIMSLREQERERVSERAKERESREKLREMEESEKWFSLSGNV